MHTLVPLTRPGQIFELVSIVDTLQFYVIVIMPTRALSSVYCDLDGGCD